MEESKLIFDGICRSVAAEGLEGAGIGTMAEKRMHKALKRYICPDESCHEVRIKPDGTASTEDREKAESGRGGYIADIYKDGEIFEIQTAGFYPLKKKIEFYLKNTDFKVTVVHPLVECSVGDSQCIDVSARAACACVARFCRGARISRRVLARFWGDRRYVPFGDNRSI